MRQDNSNTPLVHRVLRAPSIIAVALLLLSAGTLPAAAQETAADRVENLRTQLSQAQTAYAEALSEGKQSTTALARVEELRADLREQVGQLLRKSASSDATLAVYRANADTTLDAIRAYESTLAAGHGENTTLWNVLSRQELEEMHRLAGSRLSSLKLDRLKFPPEQVPPSLEFRIREVEVWRNNLDAEIARRGMGGDQIRLRPIRGDLTADEAAMRYARIKAADGLGGRAQVFEQRLALQVQLRLHGAPDDAALINMGRSLPDITPPENPPTFSRGPPQSFQAAQQQLSRAHFDELRAATQGDRVALANARARASTNRGWFDAAMRNIPESDSLGYSATPTRHLQTMRDVWSESHARLVLQRQPTSGLDLELQIEEAAARVRKLDELLAERMFPRPPPDGGDWNPDLMPRGPSPPKGPELRAYERGWESRLKYNEVSELTRVSNNPVPMTNAEIAEARTLAFNQRVTAEAQSLRTAYDETAQLGRKLLINGRGKESLEAFEQLKESQVRIRAAAHELLDSLSDPRHGANPVVREAKELLDPVVRAGEKPPAAAGEYGRAMTSLERTHDAVETASKTKGAEIQAVSASEMKPAPEYRIRLVDKPPQQSSILKLKRPAEYSELWDKGSTKTLKDLISDPRRAPGGIIIDAVLPTELTRRIESLSVDVKSGVVTARMEGVSRVVKAPHDPLMVRLAWAFVLDGRSALIDLRPLENSEASWLYWQYGTKRLSEGEMTTLVRNLRSLTSVNVNDAVRDSPVVPQLITADQLMFDLLPQSSIGVEREDYGLPLDELRRAFRADAGEELNNPDWQDTLYRKSLLTVSAASYEAGPELIITPQFSFHLFGVPARGDKAIRLTASEQWFTSHQDRLRSLPQLSWLSDFSALVTLFRSAHAGNVRHNLDELIAVPVPVSDAPRFIMRKSRISPENWRQLHDTLSEKEK
jgi:hypothetical protein